MALEMIKRYITSIIYSVILLGLLGYLCLWLRSRS